ncbi:DUF3224 domain-containing protein [Solilutibacter silvestris]|uniref:DUF3224 domain-containing protein n=1 Tax=Solilutibacter silvestris TaxID=1645665 RepID=A0A2K1Q3I5_9GAMM|nr:DUF3224 domain-containing protein [Lysobacter silvestris]PNS09598.1 hypothetical protein Lysil_1227 [Lysobacter silvestris]
MPIATGSFTLQMKQEPGLDLGDGAQTGSFRFDKQFSGSLAATSVVQMISAGNPASGSAAYVAIERIAGTLDGRAGSFMTCHRGIMDGGDISLDVTIVPSSGSGELEGIRGSMKIRVEGGVHFYDLDYGL